MNWKHAVLLSLAVHFALALGLRAMPHFEPPVPAPFTLNLESPTEQERQDARKARENGEKQIVRQVEVPQNLQHSTEKKRRFLSQKDQTVLQETRAAASGLTQNRSTNSDSERAGIPGLNSSGATGEARMAKAARKQINERNKLNLNPEMRSEALPPGDGDVAAPAAVSNESRPLKLPDFARLGGLARGESTVGERLPPDIKFGMLTALNTDRYVHYSFYARFEELFRHHWVKWVRLAMYSYQRNHRARNQQTWTSQLEIVLDPQGHFLRGILHEGSGFKDLDAAPVEAMHEVPQVPNPPAEMVQADGAVHLMYQFDVQYAPQYASGRD